MLICYHNNEVQSIGDNHIIVLICYANNQGRSIEDNGKAIRLDLDTGSYKVGRYKNINKN